VTENNETLTPEQRRDLYIKGLEEKAEKGDVYAKYQLRMERHLDKAAVIYDDFGNPRVQP